MTRSACHWLLVLALATMPAAAQADDATTHAVHFATGSNASSLDGSLKGYATVNYTLAARAGQAMEVSLSGSNDAYFNLIPPEQDYAMEGAIELKQWSGKLPADGVYRIEVFQPRAQARRGQAIRYTIRFRID